MSNEHYWQLPVLIKVSKSQLCTLKGMTPFKLWKVLKKNSNDTNALEFLCHFLTPQDEKLYFWTKKIRFNIWWWKYLYFNKLGFPKQYNSIYKCWTESLLTPVFLGHKIFSTISWEKQRAQHFRTPKYLSITLYIVGVTIMWNWTNWFHISKKSLY